MTLTLYAVIPFFHRILQLMMLYYHVKSGCKWTSSLEDIVKIVILWSHMPSLRPWPWTQWTNFSAWHFALRCCITISGLATKCSVVQKMSSRQTVTNILNHSCDLDLECSNPIFHRTLQLTILHYQIKFGCEQTSSLADMVKIVIFWLDKPSWWPWQWR